MIFRKFIKKYLSSILAKVYWRYNKRKRKVKFQGLRIVITSGVFHPTFFLSTKFLAETISSYNVENKSLLDVGCGTGALSLVASKLGANVTAIDINQNAVACCLENSVLNRLNIKVVESNLWSNLPKCSYDFIVVNPPYYPQEATNISEKAWYCGEGFEYFEDFFKDLKSYISEKSIVLMVLSEDCEIDTIRAIASEHNFSLSQIRKERILWEINFIYKIVFASGEKDC